MLDVEGPDLGPADENLVVRAARSILGDPPRAGLCFRLAKSLPVQAGLGGGSGNAAAALLATRDLAAPKASEMQLRVKAAELGSDVGFFLSGGYALGRGRGQKLTPIPSARRLAVAIVKPEQGISTRLAYSRLDISRPRVADDFDRAAEAAAARLAAALADPGVGLDALAEPMENDFDPIAAQLVPGLPPLLQALRDEGAVKAMVCGSGSAVFGLFEDLAWAQGAAAHLSARWPEVRTFSGLTGGPGVEVEAGPAHA